MTEKKATELKTETSHFSFKWFFVIKIAVLIHSYFRTLSDTQNSLNICLEVYLKCSKFVSYSSCLIFKEMIVCEHYLLVY